MAREYTELELNSSTPILIDRWSIWVWFIDVSTRCLSYRLLESEKLLDSAVYQRGPTYSTINSVPSVRMKTNALFSLFPLFFQILSIRISQFGEIVEKW